MLIPFLIVGSAVAIFGVWMLCKITTLSDKAKGRQPDEKEEESDD